MQALEVGVQLEESLAYSDLQEIRKLHGGATYKNSKLLKKKLHCGANEFAVNPLIKQSGQKKLKCQSVKEAKKHSTHPFSNKKRKGRGRKKERRGNRKKK